MEEFQEPNILWMDGIRSHHFETMVETTVCWYLQGNHPRISLVQDFVHPQYFARGWPLDFSRQKNSGLRHHQPEVHLGPPTRMNETNTREARINRDLYIIHLNIAL